MYRAPIEVNRLCARAERERMYNIHLKKLKTIKPSVDCHSPIVPKSIGINAKRYEIQKQRNLEIQRDNKKLVHNLDKILKEEHYQFQPPGRVYTLKGRYDKEEFRRIKLENKKIVKAVQSSRPILNRNDWYLHKLDHEYQHAKNAEYKQTVPMSEIMRQQKIEAISARNQKKAMEEYDFFSPIPPSKPRPQKARPQVNSGVAQPVEPEYEEGFMKFDTEPQKTIVEGDNNDFSMKDIIVDPLSQNHQQNQEYQVPQIHPAPQAEPGNEAMYEPHEPYAPHEPIPQEQQNDTFENDFEDDFHEEHHIDEQQAQDQSQNTNNDFESDFISEENKSTEQFSLNDHVQDTILNSQENDGNLEQYDQQPQENEQFSLNDHVQDAIVNGNENTENFEQYDQTPQEDFDQNNQQQEDAQFSLNDHIQNAIENGHENEENFEQYDEQPQYNVEQNNEQQYQEQFSLNDHIQDAITNGYENQQNDNFENGFEQPELTQDQNQFSFNDNLQYENANQPDTSISQPVQDAFENAQQNADGFENNFDAQNEGESNPAESNYVSILPNITNVIEENLEDNFDDNLEGDPFA